MGQEARDRFQARNLGSADATGPDVLERMQARLRQFYGERDWDQFHSLKDLAAGISIEAAELQQFFLWRDATDSAGVLSERRHDVEAELADVFIHCLNFARLARIDIEAAVLTKIEANARKYPVAAVRGRVVSHRRAEGRDAP
jgi:dCTP diphosphatase